MFTLHLSTRQVELVKDALQLMIDQTQEALDSGSVERDALKELQSFQDLHDDLEEQINDQL